MKDFACPEIRRAQLVWNKGIAAMCDWRIPDEFPIGREYSAVSEPEGHTEPPYLLGNLISDPTRYRDIQNGDLVWTRLSWFKSLITQVLPLVKSKCFLVTGDYDVSIPSGAMLETEAILRDSHVMHWYAQNCDVPGFAGRLSPLPIGVDFHTLSDRGMWGENISSSQKQEQVLLSIRRDLAPVQQRIPKVYIDFAWQRPDLRPYARRQKIIEQLRTNECVYLQQRALRRSRMWQKRGQYSFVLSPHGMGLDCHRTWEALALGHIVLVPKSPLDILYVGLPVVPIEDWNDITSKNLDKWLGDYSRCELEENKLRTAYWIAKMRAMAKEKLNCT